MKLTIISGTEAVTDQQQEIHEEYISKWKSNIEKITASETDVEIKEVERGVRRAIPDTVEPYSLNILNGTYMLDAAREAAEEGADAVIIGGSEDPGLLEARRILDVPVAGIGQATMHHAAQIGHRFGIITCNYKPFEVWWERQVQKYDLDSVFTDVVPLEMDPVETYASGFVDPEPVAEAMRQAAQKCYENGAEVVVIGSLGMGIMASAAGLSGLEDPEVPILDMTPLGVKKAETMVKLQEGLGVPHTSRAGYYRKMDEDDIERIRSIFPE